MKIINLTESSTTYTSNVFLVLGSWNTLDDVNSLIDVGRESAIIEKIYNTSTGIGKKKIDQVILTHNHYDHTSLLSAIKEVYQPVVYAFSNTIPGVNHLLKDGDQLKIGDQMAEIIHFPAHSNDSICIYCCDDKLLFAGDSPLIIDSALNSFSYNFVEVLEKICEKEIKTIYFGHGSPLKRNCNERLSSSLEIVKESYNNKMITY